LSSFRGADSPAPPWTWAVVLLAMAVMCWAYFPLHADDAYIVARYVQQILAGHGIVYNAGERVAAFTSPGHLLVLTALGATSEHYVELYRVGAAIAVAATTVWLGWRAWGGSYRGVVFSALVLTSPFVTYWTVGGLETPLLLLAVSSMTMLATNPSMRLSPAWGWQVIVLGALAILIRYDASLFALPLMLSVLWTQRDNSKVLVTAALSALIGGAWLAFSYIYFGDLLPTSFYVKAGNGPRFDESIKGLVYVLSFGLLSWLWLPILAERAIRVDEATRDASVQWRAVSIGLSLVLLYAVWASTKHMMYLNRLLAPYVPVLAYVALQRRRGPSRISSPVLLGVTLLAQSGLALAVYFQSQNPSLALLYEGRDESRETFEFSHAGARGTGQFLALVALQAGDIQTHWAAVGARRPPRMFVLTAGLLPFLVPEAYVFEVLVSYRHRCVADHLAASDYVQVIYPESDMAAFEAERLRQGRETVSRRTFVVDGFRHQSDVIRVELWYRFAEHAVGLSSRIGEACN